MKIDNSIKSTPGSGTKETRQRKASGKAAQNLSQQPSGQDEVKITSLSSQLQALESSLASSSVVDTARVDAIKQAITEGRFIIDTSVVADRLLSTVKEMLINRKD